MAEVVGDGPVTAAAGVVRISPTDIGPVTAEEVVRLLIVGGRIDGGGGGQAARLVFSLANRV